MTQKSADNGPSNMVVRIGIQRPPSPLGRKPCCIDLTKHCSDVTTTSTATTASGTATTGGEDIYKDISNTNDYHDNNNYHDNDENQQQYEYEYTYQQQIKQRQYQQEQEQYQLLQEQHPYMSLYHMADNNDNNNNNNDNNKKLDNADDNDNDNDNGSVNTGKDQDEEVEDIEVDKIKSNSDVDSEKCKSSSSSINKGNESLLQHWDRYRQHNSNSNSNRTSSIMIVMDNPIPLMIPKDIPCTLPPNFKPGPFDVICARGKQAFNHDGNKYFRGILSNATDKYSKVESKQQRSMIVTDIVDAIRGKGNGFVWLNTKTGEWCECSDVACREKVGRYFRQTLGRRFKSRSVISFTSYKSKRESKKQIKKQQEGATEEGSANAAIII